MAYSCASASSIEDNCTRGNGCCEAVNGETWMDVFRRRSGLADAVIHKVATAHPLAEALGGVESLVGGPLSPEVLRGEAHDLWLRLHVLRISEIDEKHQQFQMHYKLTWFWRDCRLLSDCAEMVVNDRHSDFGKFWAPSYRIKELEGDKEELRVSSHVITGHGWDAFSEEHVSRFRCVFDLRDLPYDTQSCSLKFLLPDMADSKFRLQWGLVTSDKLRDLEWKIDQGEDWQLSVKNVPGFHPLYIRKPQNSSELVTRFRLERKSHHLMHSYMYASMLNYLLSLGGMLLDPTSVPARATYGLLTVLVQSSLVSSFTDKLPPIGYATRLGLFLHGTMTLICIHTWVYGVMHFCTRWLKALKISEKPSRVSPADVEEEVNDGKWLGRFKRSTLTYCAFHLERHTRRLSPVVWIVGSIIALA